MVKLAFALMIAMSESRRMENSHARIVQEPDDAVATHVETEDLDDVVDSDTVGPNNDPSEPAEDDVEPNDISQSLDNAVGSDATGLNTDPSEPSEDNVDPIDISQSLDSAVDSETVGPNEDPSEATLDDVEPNDVAEELDTVVDSETTGLSDDLSEPSEDDVDPNNIAQSLDNVVDSDTVDPDDLSEPGEDDMEQNDIVVEETEALDKQELLPDVLRDDDTDAAPGSRELVVEEVADEDKETSDNVVSEVGVATDDASDTLTDLAQDEGSSATPPDTLDDPSDEVGSSTSQGGATKSEVVNEGTTEQPKTILPIPTPEEYDWNWDLVNGCYNHGSSSKSDFTVDKPPPGYKAKKGQKCPGDWIEYWSDGQKSGYGSQISDILSCAKICNRHEECAGFYSHLGVCTHFRSNATALQDTDGAEKAGYNCFVKWEVRDLDVEAPSVEPDWSDFVPGTVKPPVDKQVSDCLCVWDIDRTLTAKQGWHDQCPGTKHYDNIKDYAYTGGTLVLSELAQNIRNTFCGQCYFGVVSAGTASGPNSPNRDVLDSLVDSQYNVGDWVDGCPIPTWGTKVLCCDEGEYKKKAVSNIVSWLGSHDIEIKPENVHFFDDKANNIEAMGEGEPPHYNGHMVSCGSRDSSRGGCGGLTSEVVNTTGLHFCSNEADAEKDDEDNKDSKDSKDKDDKDEKSASCRFWLAAPAAVALFGVSIM